MSDQHAQVLFSSLLTPEVVICHTPHETRDEVIHELLEKLAYEKGIGNVEHAFEAVLEHEDEMPAIMADGIAVPHARLEAINEIVVGVATSVKGIKYAEEVSEPVKLMVLILVPKDAPGAYLQALSSLARICQKPDTVATVTSLKKADEVWKFFDRGGVVLPDHLLTRDIMNPVKVVLQENDTLERAIDLFVRHGRLALPVVDKDNDLIGVVTTYELLRVALPDYILWMDDLTPILNFEPFADVLRNESKTWLAEIMTDEYATITEDAPAIQVAKEITRYRTDHAFVVRGNKLVGVVSLEDFLRKILRE